MVAVAATFALIFWIQVSIPVGIFFFYNICKISFILLLLHKYFFYLNFRFLNELKFYLKLKLKNIFKVVFPVEITP